MITTQPADRGFLAIEHRLRHWYHSAGMVEELR